MNGSAKRRLDRLEDRIGVDGQRPQDRIAVIKGDTQAEVDRAIKRFLAGDKPKAGAEQKPRPQYRTIFIVPAFEQTARASTKQPDLFKTFVEREIIEQMPDDERDRLLADLRRRAAAIEGDGHE